MVSLDLELPDCVRLSGQQALALANTDVTDVYYHVQLCTWVQGVGLRSSCLCGKRSTDSFLLSPLNLCSYLVTHSPCTTDTQHGPLFSSHQFMID